MEENFVRQETALEFLVKFALLVILIEQGP